MKLFNRKKKIKTVKDLLLKIYNDKYKSNGGFNIMQIRDNVNEFQIIHSGILKKLELTNNDEFGYTIIISFGQEKRQYLEKFRNSRFVNLFTLQSSNEKYENYYYDCKLDKQLVENICYEICKEIYDYNDQTKFEFQFIEY